MQKEGSGAPLSPVVTWVIIGVVVLAVIALGIKMLSPNQGNFQKSGSEDLIKKAAAGGKVYNPPAAAFPPGAGPNAGKSPGMPGGAVGMPHGGQ